MQHGAGAAEPFDPWLCVQQAPVLQGRSHHHHTQHTGPLTDRADLPGARCGRLDGLGCRGWVKVCEIVAGWFGCRV